MGVASLADGRREVRGSRWRSILSWPSTCVRGLLLLLIRLYQRAVSPRIGARCRFSPSCSEYAVESLRKHGLLRGVLQSTWRIMRCNPFGGSGYDPP